MKDIRVQYTYTAEDAVEYSVEVTKSLLSWSQLLPWVGVGVVASMAITLAAFLLGKSVTNPTPIIALGVAFFAVPMLTRWAAMRFVVRNPGIGSVMTLNISDSGLTIAAFGAERNIGWEKVTRIEEKQTGFLLFSEPRLMNWLPRFAAWLPKRGFAAESALQTFREMARSKNIRYRG